MYEKDVRSIVFGGVCQALYTNKYNVRGGGGLGGVCQALKIHQYSDGGDCQAL